MLQASLIRLLSITIYGKQQTGAAFMLMYSLCHVHALAIMSVKYYLLKQIWPLGLPIPHANVNLCTM